MNDRKPSLVNKFWSGFAYYISGIYNRADQHHIFLMAGGLAFTLFVCFVPLILIVFSVLGNFLERPTVTEEIQLIIEKLIPYPEYADDIKSIIISRLQTFTEFKQIAGILGGIGIIFAGSSLFSSIRTVLTTIFHPKYSEQVLIGKLWDFALVVLVLLLFLSLIFVVPVVQAGVELTTSFEWLKSLGISALDQFVLKLISVTAVFLTFLIIYIIVPLKHPKFRVALVSAISVTLLWQIAEELFGYYISHVATLQNIYGVYAFLVIVAFWIYYSALSFIIGAEIGQLYDERKNMFAQNDSIFFRNEIRPM